MSTSTPNPSTSISVQVYSVRDAFAAAPSATLGHLAALGFTQVEPFMLSQSADTLATLLPEHGLTAPTAHEDVLGGDLTASLDAARRCGVGTLVQPFSVPDQWREAADVDAIAAALNEAARVAADAGVRIGYHNHAHEVSATIDGVTGLEYLASRLDEGVVLEVDAYWAAVGGQDPAVLVERLGGRVVALHLKDGEVPDTPLTGLPAEMPVQVPVGQGRVPLTPLLATVSPEVLRVVEFDGYDGDVFEAIAASRAALLA